LEDDSQKVKSDAKARKEAEDKKFREFIDAAV